ncbi:hypothetical protein BD779DRAFT_1666247 [Infundibulicybe gibba]|nr:hypothetical protein BD779DRAFT_1666247 [Infundibulicybe gibba]
MANTDKETTVVSDLTEREAVQLSKLPAGQQGGLQASDSDNAPAQPSSSISLPPPPSSASQPHPSARPALVQLGSSPGATPTSTALHPKKFSAVNINKKFSKRIPPHPRPCPLHLYPHPQNQAAPSPTARPQAPASTSHPRLVTTKLTASNPSSSTTGPGWSRPSSATPPTTNGTPAPNGGTSLLSSPIPAPASASSPSAAPQLPAAGKVIQPQPRALLVQHGAVGTGESKAPSKPVWGNIKMAAGSPPHPDARVQNDFPTAAEVAQVAETVRNAKATDTREAAETAAANKQARMEEADTFRGVHLDPNAHHWDEMEEDDDNFLDAVIDFGDGRQYKIQSTDPPSGTHASSRLDDASATDGTSAQPNVSVSKEERFADDFDRSWPRSRTSPVSSEAETLPAPTAPVAHPAPAAQATLPPQDSRVLFNERSNRLEPYSSANPPHRPGQASFPPKRNSHHDHASSPSDLRVPRDFPPASPLLGNIQLLQKSGPGEYPPRARGFSGSGSGSFGPGSNGFHTDRPGYGGRNPPMRRDGPSSGSNNMHPPSSPRLTRDEHHPYRNASPVELRDRDDHRGRTNMGPPPPPHSLRGSSRESTGRQLPPHLASTTGAPLRRVPSRDPQMPTSATSSGFPGHSPALSHASLSAPELDEMKKNLMQNAAARAKQRRQEEEAEREKEKERARRKAAEMEEKIKAAEVEKKAEELENAKNKAVNTIIQEAVKIAESPKLNASEHLPSHHPPFSGLPLRRPSSLKPAVRPPMHHRTPSHPTASEAQSSSTPTSALPPAVRAESWRSKAAPASAPPVHEALAASQLPPAASPAQSTSFDRPAALQRLESIATDGGDDLEVVDFEDMAKFMGVPDAPAVEPSIEEEPETGANKSMRTPRPVASDFFDDAPVIETLPVIPPPPGPAVVAPPAQTPAEDGGAPSTTWRPKPMQPSVVSQGRASVSEIKDGAGTAASKEEPVRPRGTSAAGTTHGSDNISPSSSREGILTTADHHPHSHTQTVIAPLMHTNNQRTPRVQSFYREPAMSALDDTMSRIKGALHGMHAGEPSKAVSPSSISESSAEPPTRAPPSGPAHFSTKSPPRERWAPPAVRLRGYDLEVKEVFDVSGMEPPHSPKPMWNMPLVKLPPLSPILEPVSKKQMLFIARHTYPMRWDILSFDPPVEGMSRRDLSLNDLLFIRPPAGYKGKPKHRVVLPRPKQFSTGPRVNIPAHGPPRINGAFGRPSGADNLTTWRKTVPPPTPKSEAVEITPVTAESVLNTTSRSPPPDLAKTDANVMSIPKSTPSSASSSPSKNDEYASSVRPRPQPKMPAGSVVACRRDSRIDAVEADPNSLVSFIVSSELEDSRGESQAPTPTPPQPSITVSPPPGHRRVSDPISSSSWPKANGRLSPKASGETALPALVQSKLESKASDDDSSEPAPITPPQHHTASWVRPSMNLAVKEPTARGPDPEHLKAVWSQTSNKAGLHAVNSLEGIADDLTALPFTLQDVKSEDGETPPPIPSAPSRMSLHEVTRAFQQVPQSAAATPHRTQISPPSTSAPVARPSPYSYQMPPAPSAMRPTYVPYPSPMISHSPSPAVVYPHHIASSPVPSRMAVGGHNPMYPQPMWMTMPGPAPNPNNMMRSPYPAQMMTYPSPSTPTMYPHALPSPMPNPAQQQNAMQANRNRNMAMMSPVMSQAAPQMYAASPVLMHAAAMQVPPTHGYMPLGRTPSRPDHGHMPAQPSPHGAPSNSHTHHPGFNQVPQQSYMRPQW